MKSSDDMNYIIGIDEVGRGPLAGPVTVCALALPADYKVSQVIKLKVPLRDSKKLTETQRKVWYAYIKNHPEVRYAVCHVQPRVIDRINIRESANLAATRALYKLYRLYNFRSSNIFLDGGLYLDENFKSQISNIKIRTVIRGDEKYIAVRLASIMAKVRRDALMSRLHKKYPEYGFQIHKGYGTKQHMSAIRKYGKSGAHRLTFL